MIKVLSKEESLQRKKEIIKDVKQLIERIEKDENISINSCVLENQIEEGPPENGWKTFKPTGERSIKIIWWEPWNEN